MIYELNHVGVQVRDLDAVLAFYTEVLGGRVVSEALIPASKTDCIYVQIADGLIELLHPRQPAAGHRYGYNHIAFMTDDLDGEYERLESAGHAFGVTPRVAGSGRGRLGFLNDPNGVRVELIERSEDWRGPVSTEGFARSIDHVVVGAPDLEAANHFYVNDIGMHQVEGVERQFSRVSLGLDTLGLAAGAGSPSIGPVVLAVENLEVGAGALRAAGTRVGSGSPGAPLAFEDPDGNQFACCQA